nr:MAG TPA: hypothetical protein [Caudoviricetes sp.]
MKGFLGAPVLTEANNTRTVHEKRPTNRPTERPSVWLFPCPSKARGNLLSHALPLESPPT